MDPDPDRDKGNHSQVCNVVSLEGVCSKDRRKKMSEARDRSYWLPLGAVFKLTQMST